MVYHGAFAVEHRRMPPDSDAYTSKTPCIGLCSTVFGDLVCRGCKRFSHEIIDWNRYDNGQRAAVWNRLEQLLEQLIWNRFELVSVWALEGELKRLKVPADPNMPVCIKVWRLLPRLAEGGLASAGLRLQPLWHGSTLKQVRDNLDQAFFDLSTAYYDRRVP